MLNVTDIVVGSLRALSFVVVIQAAGAAIFLSLFESELVGTSRFIRRLTFLAAVGGCLLVISQHLAEPARMTGSFSGIWDSSLQAILLASNAGTSRAVRITGLVVIAWSAVSNHPLSNQLGMVGAVLTIGSFMLMGHTAAHSLRWMLAVLLLVHLLVSAFWFGSLMSFWFTSTREQIATNAAIVQRFSAIAGWLVPLVLLAGIGMAFTLIRDLATLTSPYGLLILVKFFAFGGLLALAAWNKWSLGPAIAQGSLEAQITFRRVVGAEWVTIAALLVLTSVMTGLFGPD